MVGFRRIFHGDEEWSEVTTPRQFGFTEQPRYKALVTGLGQYQAITDYENQRKIPVYYLMYNPARIPSTAVLPIVPGQHRAPGACDAGCRVVPAAQLRESWQADPMAALPRTANCRHCYPHLSPIRTVGLVGRTSEDDGHIRA